jgi:predicted O-methyltransferase YrrM
MEKYYFQYGGNPEWYNNFNNELKDIYFNVKRYTNNLTLSGSAAIAIILHKLDMTSDLNTFDKPNDFDFIYIDKDIYHPLIPNFKKSTNNLVKSITYTRNNDVESFKINSFDLIFIPSRGAIYNIIINGMYVLHPKSLLSYYNANDDDTSRDHEKDQRRILLLNKILAKITDKEGNYIEGFEFNKFKQYPDDVLSDISNISQEPLSSTFESPTKKLKFDSDEEASNSFSTPEKLENPEKTGGSINEFYKQKYLKYKLKYKNLKKNI